MGNSLTSQPNQLSKKQLLSNEYELFTVPPEFQNPNSSSSQSPSNHTPKIVYGKKYLKAIFNVSQNFVHTSESSQQIDQYFLRHQSPQANLFPLVKVLAVKQGQQNNMCSSFNWYCVITEDLTLFNQIENKFSFEESLYVLFECLMGFYYLYVNNGTFKITEKMIGIDNQGKLKLWMSENFALNRVQDATIQLYVNRNFTSRGQAVDMINHRNLEKKMVKQIFSIINTKYQDRSTSFSQTLQTNIKRSLREVSVEQMSFQQLLRILCEYEQKCGSSFFIPNKIRLEKNFETKLPERQSFSLKLQKAINEYRQQRKSVEQKDSVDMTSEKGYSTGMYGNTLKKYVPNQNGQTVGMSTKRPQVKFSYQDYGIQSGLMQSGYFMNENISHFNFSQYHRDYSVRDAESQVIGIRKSEFVERLEDFNQARPKNDYVNHSYVPGEYEQEIESMSKDLRDTYFKSTRGSQVDQPWMMKSSSYGEGFMMEENISRSSSQLQLISSKLVEELTSVRQRTTPSSLARTTASSLAPSNVNWKVQNSSYKQKMIAPYLSEDSANNFMRITEQIQQESYRPSLMSINVEGKSSFNRADQGMRESEKEKEQAQFMEQNMVSPIIESRFTENIRVSPDYIQKPFSLAYNNNNYHNNKLSVGHEQKYRLQSLNSFY